MDVQIGSDIKGHVKLNDRFHIGVKIATVIFLSFLLTSTGWLSWEYHLLDQTTTRMTDVYTMIVGYLLQACGMAFYTVIERNRFNLCIPVVLIAVSLHMICMVPAVLSPYLIGTLVFGFLMNLFCGIIAGYYLLVLTAIVDKKSKARVFGTAYAISILASWLLSKVNGGSLYYSERILIICLILSISDYILIRWMHGRTNGIPDSKVFNDNEAPEEISGRNDSPRSYMPVYICAVVFLFSLVNNSGFAFPSADISKSVNVELSRLVYAVGLIIAGMITDRKRSDGAVCALAALIIPFIILALRGENHTAVLFWILSYFTFGFYSVYRIICFSDIASDRGYIWLSAFGLMIGRIGDALGEGFCLTLSDNLTIRILVTAILFAVSVLLFIKIYPFMYIQTDGKDDEKRRFYQYAMRHDLSSRERDLLRLILEEKTNSEIADILCISENTVKFHAKNLFQKTGTGNRNELLSDYYNC